MKKLLPFVLSVVLGFSPLALKAVYTDRVENPDEETVAKLVEWFRCSPETIPEKTTILSHTYADALLQQLTIPRMLPTDPVKAVMRAQFPEHDPQDDVEFAESVYLVMLDYEKVQNALRAYSCECAEQWSTGIKAAIEDISKEWSPEHKKEFLETNMVHEVGTCLFYKIMASERDKNSVDSQRQR